MFLVYWPDVLEQSLCFPLLLTNKFILPWPASAVKKKHDDIIQFSPTFQIWDSFDSQLRVCPWKPLTVWH